MEFIVRWLESSNILVWTKIGLYGIGAAGILIGLLSFFSPGKSIGLYQAIMRWFNWRVEPIRWDWELRSTRGLGALMLVLSLAIFLILLNGCAHNSELYGYRAVQVSKGPVLLPVLGTQHPFLGMISKDKMEMLTRYGMPQYVSEDAFDVPKQDRQVNEWVYLDHAKRFYFYTDSDNLFAEEDLAPLDIISYKGNLEAGMTPEQVRRVKGEPAFVTSSDLDFGASEKWVYRVNDQTSESFYFSRGMLFTWRTENKRSSRE
jgi:hypothetical protein